MSDLITLPRATVQQALEALFEIDWSNNSRWQSDRAGEAIPALRAALEQLPIVECTCRAKDMPFGRCCKVPPGRDWSLLEATQESLREHMAEIHRLRAALEQQEQEPVAWRTFDGEGGYDYRTYDDNEDYAQRWDNRNPNHQGWVEPLYTTQPPLVQPVELEDLKADVARLKRKVARLDKECSEHSWTTNPDRSGGAWTQEEIDRSKGW